MSEPDIKRAAELFIVGKLKAAYPEEAIYPFTGGDRTTGATEVEPPFTIVAIPVARRQMATEGTWLCDGVVQVISHQAEMTTENQAERARRIYEALSNIAPSPGLPFTFHGIDITDMHPTEDAASDCHADVISFTVGVGG